MGAVGRRSGRVQEYPTVGPGRRTSSFKRQDPCVWQLTSSAGNNYQLVPVYNKQRLGLFGYPCTSYLRRRSHRANMRHLLIAELVAGLAAKGELMRKTLHRKTISTFAVIFRWQMASPVTNSHTLPFRSSPWLTWRVEKRVVSISRTFRASQAIDLTALHSTQT